MKQTIDLNDFRQAFRDYDRQDNFSYKGLEMLFDFFEESDPEMELDVIAICCDFNEDRWEEIAGNYSIDLDDYEEENDKIKAVEEYLSENTLLIGSTNSGTSFVYQVF